MLNRRKIRARANFSRTLAVSLAATLFFFFFGSSFFLSSLPSSRLHPHFWIRHKTTHVDSGPGRRKASRAMLGLKSDPLKPRLDHIRKQADHHRKLVLAYASYARKLKLDNSKLLRIFSDLSRNFTDLITNPAYRSLSGDDSIEEEPTLRNLEKQAKGRVKATRNVILQAKESFDNQVKIQKLKDRIFSVNEQLTKVKKQGAFSSLVLAKSIPRSLHCLSMRLMEEMIARPEKYSGGSGKPELEDPKLYHYAIFSDNVIAASVVVNSAVRNAKEPWKHVFHVVTDKMNLGAMQVMFGLKDYNGAHIEVKAVEYYNFLNLNSSYVAVLNQLESVNLRRFYFENEMENATKDGDNMKFMNPKYSSILNHLRFYLPQMYPKLDRILLLDDDIVVQKDLSGLWKIDMHGKVNGAVETCSESFHRYVQYMNFSHPLIKEKFNPNGCVWACGLNFFDLDAWRKERCTEEYHYWQTLNENRTLWKLGTLPPGLITFYSTMMPLEKSWHVLGLGYNPNISMAEIQNAAVIHFNGDMKPWLDIAVPQFKPLWAKYVDSDLEFIQACNFAL